MHIEVTPQKEGVGGKWQDSVRNSWKKLIECQERIKFWQTMILGGLGVRDLQHFGDDLKAKYRSEAMRLGEGEKEVVKLAMDLKLRDDRRYQIELRQERKRRREELRLQIGNERSFKRVMTKINAEMKKVRQSERNRLNEKAEHLRKIKEEIETRKLEDCPEEIKMYKNIKLFNKTEM